MWNYDCWRRAAAKQELIKKVGLASASSVTAAVPVACGTNPGARQVLRPGCQFERATYQSSQIPFLSGWR